MEVIDGSFMPPCNEFSQTFTSHPQSSQNVCSPYLDLSSMQPKSPGNQYAKMAPFSTSQAIPESQKESLNNSFVSNQTNGYRNPPNVCEPTKSEEGHTCEVCQKVFSERSLLQKHKIAHAEAKHICSTCGRAFVREDKLRRHIRSIHSDERPYVCEVCTKAFARKDKLQEHSRHHNRDITFPCHLCNEVFLMRSILNRHLRTQHQVKTTDLQKTQGSIKPGQTSNGGRLDNSRKKSKRKADCGKSAAGTTASVAAEKATGFAPYAATQQDPMGWNAANLLLYNRYQQQQQQPQQPQQQMEMPWGASNYLYPSAHAAAAYQISPQYAAAMMRQPRSTISDQQLQQQQQQQHPTETDPSQQQHYLQSPSSAFSAAMAARLFSHSNYANWWPQAGQNLMFPRGATGCYPMATGDQTAQHLDLKSATGIEASTVGGAGASRIPLTNLGGSAVAGGGGGYASSPLFPGLPSAAAAAAAVAAGNAVVAATSTSAGATTDLPTASDNRVGQQQCSDLQLQQQQQQQMMRPGMLASLPSFAQAVYYRAASLAASQNGFQSASGLSQVQAQQQQQQQQQQQLASFASVPYSS